MATYCETVIFTDTETPSCDSVVISTDRLAILISESPGSPSLLTVHGTLDQLEGIARQIERLITLRRHDLEAPAPETPVGPGWTAADEASFQEQEAQLRAAEAASA